VFDLRHALMPLLQSNMSGGQFVMTGIQEILDHPKQIEIDEARTLFQ
jgi:hypothetical protein